jgi:hypothetical protein
MSSNYGCASKTRSAFSSSHRSSSALATSFFEAPPNPLELAGHVLVAAALKRVRRGSSLDSYWDANMGYV